MAKPEGPQALPIPEGAPDLPAPQAPSAPPAPPAPLAHCTSQVLQVLQQPVLHMLPLNWSQFKPKLSRKAEKDAEAHLLRTNGWMDTHRFQDNDKGQRFCLTLTGEARLWYESLRPISADWIGLKNSFGKKYSNTDNTKEQLFHAWRLFYFNKYMETIDTYIHHIKQVATLLGYQEL